MLSSVIYLFALTGLVFGAGYAGGLVASQKAPRVEARNSAPWSAYERAREIENIGFFSGAAGGTLILSLVLVCWWIGYIQVRINF
jgi:hypothetical protein